MKPVECPCGGASPVRRPNAKAPRYDLCCARFIEGGEKPANAMELMRSRYTAYVLGNTPYLRSTWAEETCPPDLDASDTTTRWLGLDIKRHTVVDINNEEVEFIARYKVDGRAHRLHEASRFRRNSIGNWIYIDGEIKNK
ncbi:YchJ family protein [Caballeronia sp. BR00000012568055]|uniref:YchJ family protein n=1 Tax=Caballeronia sp. BR00000012568055 TaxID=2918761 RepID=UPI0023F82DFD|nr:YchJ family protein [Caballeronia sp. BR00000012568055]